MNMLLKLLKENGIWFSAFSYGVSAITSSQSLRQSSAVILALTTLSVYLLTTIKRKDTPSLHKKPERYTKDDQTLKTMQSLYINVVILTIRMDVLLHSFEFLWEVNDDVIGVKESREGSIHDLGRHGGVAADIGQEKGGAEGLVPLFYF